MEDFIEDFDDDFGDYGNDFMDDDSIDEAFDDEFTTKEAEIIGSDMRWIYEEGLEEAERKKLEKKMNAYREQSNNHS